MKSKNTGLPHPVVDSTHGSVFRHASSRRVTVNNQRNSVTRPQSAKIMREAETKSKEKVKFQVSVPDPQNFNPNPHFLTETATTQIRKKLVNKQLKQLEDWKRANTRTLRALVKERQPEVIPRKVKVDKPSRSNLLIYCSANFNI